jgi:hypothetical protein
MTYVRPKCPDCGGNGFAEGGCSTHDRCLACGGDGSSKIWVDITPQRWRGTPPRVLGAAAEAVIATCPYVVTLEIRAESLRAELRVSGADAETWKLELLAAAAAATAAAWEAPDASA